MFDKFKARIEKLEETNETFRNAKQHVEKYQVVYASIGASGLTLVAVKLFGKPQVIVTAAESLPAVVNNTIHNTPVFNNTVNNGGHCIKVVQDIATGDLWPKVNALAEELAEQHGVSFETARQYLSRHLNGNTEHVFGRQYRTIALGTTG